MKHSILRSTHSHDGNGVGRGPGGLARSHAAGRQGGAAARQLHDRAKNVSMAPAMQITGKPVAKVNGAVLTDRDLLREMYTIFPYAQQHNGFPKELEPEIRRGALADDHLRGAGVPGSEAPQHDDPAGQADGGGNSVSQTVSERSGLPSSF